MDGLKKIEKPRQKARRNKEHGPVEVKCKVWTWSYHNSMSHPHSADIHILILYSGEMDNVQTLIQKGPRKAQPADDSKG